MKVRRTSAALVFGVAAAVAAGAGSSSYAAPPAKAGCQLGGYSTAAAKCVTVPASGSFSIKVPGTSTTLTGKGSRSTAGTKIHIAQVTNPNPTGKGVAVRITTNGQFNPLKLKSGKLWWFDPSSHKLQSVKKVTKQGVYVVIK
jgi:hypothetical protein